jgi:hypothetical protein
METPLNMQSNVEIPTLKMEAETCLEHTKIFAPGTIIITVSGENAYNATDVQVSRALEQCSDLGLPGIPVIGRYKQPLKWYATLTTVAYIRAYKNFKNVITVRDNNKMVFIITQREREPLKGTMHWLPLTIREEGAQEIAVFLTKDPKAKVSRIGNTNSWNFIYKRTDLSIPHFVDLQLNPAETHEEQQIWIQLPGRRTQCVNLWQGYPLGFKMPR